MKQENGMDTFGKEKMEQKCLLMMNNNIFASFMNIMVNTELAQNIGNKSLLSGYDTFHERAQLITLLFLLSMT